MKSIPHKFKRRNTSRDRDATVARVHDAVLRMLLGHGLGGGHGKLVKASDVTKNGKRQKPLHGDTSPRPLRRDTHTDIRG